jgi:hypothetical protein
MIWLLSHLLPLSPVSKLDRGHGKTEKERQLADGRGVKGLGAELRINLKKAQSSINHSILCGLHESYNLKKAESSINHSILYGLQSTLSDQSSLTLELF